MVMQTEKVNTALKAVKPAWRRLGMLASCFRIRSGIALVCVGISAAPLSRARAEDLGHYGPWYAFYTQTRTGAVACGLRTSMSDGGALLLTIIGDSIQLMAHNPAWELARDGNFSVKIAIDNESYSGTAIASDNATMVIDRLTPAFLHEFAAGNSMLADLGGVRWGVSLARSDEAANVLAACALAARRQ